MVKWIKVEDRLPESYQNGTSKKVLCYSENFGEFYVLRYYHDFNSWSHVSQHDSIYNPITHWMPLPESPN